MATVGGGSKLSASGPESAADAPGLSCVWINYSASLACALRASPPPRSKTLPCARGQFSGEVSFDCNEAMLAIQKLAQMFPQATTSAHGCGLVAPDAYQHSAAVLPLAPAAPKDVPTLKQRRKVVLEEALDDLAIR